MDQYEGGLLLQIDVHHRVLRTETVRDCLLSLAKRGGDMKAEADKHLLGTSVLTRYNNKSYKIDELDFNASPKDTFTNEKGEEVSDLDYYTNNYGIVIQVRLGRVYVFLPRMQITCKRLLSGQRSAPDPSPAQEEIRL